MKLIVSICSVFTLYSCLYTSTVVASEEDALWQTSSLFLDKVLKLHPSDNRFSSFSIFESPQCYEKVENVSDLSDFYRDESKYWDSRYGIEVRGGVTSEDIENEDLQNFGNTFLELSWDVMAQGYKEFKYKAQTARRKATLASIEHDLEARSIIHQCQQSVIKDTFFNNEIIQTIDYLALMEKVVQVEEKALLNGISTYDEYLISEEIIAKTRSRLRHLDSMMGPNAVKRYQHYPLFDLNIEKIMADAIANPLVQQYQSLQKELLLNPNEYNNGARVRFFLRKEFDLLASDREGTIAGLRFRVPVSFEEYPDNSKKVVELNNSIALSEWELKAQINQAYLNFVEQYDRTQTQFYRFKRAMQRAQRAFARHEMGENIDISAAIARLKTFAEASIELSQAKLSLFLRANTVFEKAGVSFSTNYIDHAHNQSLDYGFHFELESYLWQQEFNSYDNVAIVRALKKSGINKVYVSMPKSVDKEKLADLVRISSMDDIAIIPLLSTNEWAMPENYQKAVARIEAISNSSMQVHLDVEPHTLRKPDKQQQQSNYLGLITEVNRSIPDIRISASVPFHWRLDAYDELSDKVERLNIMMYGTDNVELIIRRLNDILTIVPQNKITVVLRGSDFESNFEIEKARREIGRKTGVLNYATHKFTVAFED